MIPFHLKKEQFALDYLQQHGDRAEEAYYIAIANAKKYPVLVSEYEKLQAENLALKAKLVATTNKLRETEIRLQVEQVKLQIKNQRLLNLAKFLYALTFLSVLSKEDLRVSRGMMRAVNILGSPQDYALRILSRVFLKDKLRKCDIIFWNGLDSILRLTVQNKVKKTIIQEYCGRCARD